MGPDYYTRRLNRETGKRYTPKEAQRLAAEKTEELTPGSSNLGFLGGAIALAEKPKAAQHGFRHTRRRLPKKGPTALEKLDRINSMIDEYSNLTTTKRTSAYHNAYKNSGELEREIPK